MLPLIYQHLVDRCLSPRVIQWTVKKCKTLGQFCESLYISHVYQSCKWNSFICHWLDISQFPDWQCRGVCTTWIPVETPQPTTLILDTSNMLNIPWLSWPHWYHARVMILKMPLVCQGCMRTFSPMSVLTLWHQHNHWWWWVCHHPLAGNDGLGDTEFADSW